METLDKALETVVTQSNKKTYITIEPFFDPNVFNLGLEKYGKVIFDGTKQIEDLGSQLVAGIERYKTGLDEFAPEVKLLPEPEKSAKIRQIREAVSKLEMELAQNVLDVSDKDFWSKTTLLNPTNKDFWSKLSLEIESDAVALDPNDPTDVLKIFAIEAGGFTLVAPSLEHAKKSNKRVNFYLSRLEDTSAVRTELKKLRNKCKGELDKLRTAKQNKLFLVAKVYMASENNFTKNTPIDVLYDKIDDRIDGVGLNIEKKKVVTEFIDIVNMDNQTLYLKALIKDAIFFRVLVMKSDKFYYTPLGNLCGKSLSDCIEFFKNAMNDSDLKEVIEKIEKRWAN